MQILAESFQDQYQYPDLDQYQYPDLDQDPDPDQNQTQPSTIN